MIDTDKYEEFENAMNEGRIERVHCLWALAEVKRLREQLAKANKYVHTICQHSDSMLMDYEDYMKGDD